MFQPDTALSDNALDEFVADITRPAAEPVSVMSLPTVANENEPGYDGIGRVAWEDDDFFYVYED